MKLKVLYFVGLTFALSFLGEKANAQIVFSDNFESYTTGNQPGGSWVVSTTNSGAGDASYSASNGGPRGAVIIPFGNVTTSSPGSGNALRLYDWDNGGSGSITASHNFTATNAFRLDLSISSDNFTGNDGNTFMRIAFGDDTMNAGTSFSGGPLGRVVIRKPNSSEVQILARDSNTSEAVVSSGLALETSISLSIVANNTGSALNYNLGGAQSVAVGMYDVFVNGALVADDFDFSPVAASGDIEQIAFFSGGGQAGADWLIDDITVSNPIPEPSTYALIGTGLVLLALSRRFRRKKA